MRVRVGVRVRVRVRVRRGDGMEASVKRCNSWVSHPPSSSDFNAERDIVKLRTG